MPGFIAPAPAAPTPRRTLLIPTFTAPATPGDRWLGEGVADMLATTLAERPGLEVARRGAAALRLEGVVERGAEGLVVHVRVVDVAAAATLAAERRTLRAPLLEEVDALAERVAVALAAGDGPRLLALTTGSEAAYRAYIDGALAAVDGDVALRRAAALDPSFFQARLALAEQAPAELPAAAALVGRAGRRGALALARVAARTPVARLAALEAQRALAPHDAAIAGELAAAYRAVGRTADCAAEAQRAVEDGVGAASADLAWCRATAGDAAGALDAARGAGDALLVGDVSLFLGRVGEARAAYARAGAAAAARLALLAARVEGRCPKTRVPVASLEDARAASAVALACSDPEAARAIEDGLRRAGEPLAEELARARSAGRGERATYARLRAAEPATGDPLDRGRRLAALFAAARAEKRAAEALADFTPAPVDRFGLFEPPLMYEMALLQLAAGDLEAAALSCGELEGSLAQLCRGRVAEEAGRFGEAFREYRDLLDRWADADEAYRPAQELKRRLRAVIAKARAAAP